jgi:chemotaxis protein methyltransferase CheR
MSKLGLPDTYAYKAYIDIHPKEWENLDSMCRVTISRFYRDRGVFDVIRSRILPEIAETASTVGEKQVQAWSSGCACGEEAYTLKILWELCIAPSDIESPQLLITATDVDVGLLCRARRGYYPASSLKDLPRELIHDAFDRLKGGYILKSPLKEGIQFIEQDIRRGMPEGPFHLVLCRNLVLTYFEESLQCEILDRIMERLIPEGILVVGVHESLPPYWNGIKPLSGARCIMRKR